MMCFVCKGELSDGFTTFMTDLGNCIVVIKNVPAKICSQCGEVSYSDEVAKKIEKIINSLRNSVSEVAITDYKTAA